MPTKAKAEAKKTLYVKFLHTGGAKKITIPAGCKITFGPLCPGTKGGNNGSDATALRVYNGASQIAVFVRVESFYEVDSVSCIQKVTKSGTKVQAYDEGGVSKNRTVKVEVSEWKDELAEEEDSNAPAELARLKAESDKDVF